jgi:hypothetical protein
MTINPAAVNGSRAPPAQEVDSPVDNASRVLFKHRPGTLLNNRDVASKLGADHPCPHFIIAKPILNTTVDSVAPEEEAPKETSAEEETKPVLPPPPRADQPPRPPNAWILYRSERLRAIAAGEPIPGLLAVLEAQSLVRALDVSEQRNPGFKDSSSSPEPNRFQLFKDAEPLTPPTEKDDTVNDTALEGGSKYRRALLQADISKVISMLWKREGREVKAKYEAMAEARKQEVSGIPCRTPFNP